MKRLKDDRCASRGVVIVTHVVSSRGSVVSLQTTAGFTQEEKKKRHAAEKEIRPSPLNIYDLGPHRFLATFFAVFRGVSTW